MPLKCSWFCKSKKVTNNGWGIHLSIKTLIVLIYLLCAISAVSIPKSNCLNSIYESKYNNYKKIVNSSVPV